MATVDRADRRRGWLGQTRLSGGGGRRLRRPEPESMTDERYVRGGRVRLFEQAVDEHPPGSRTPPVEAEGELVRV